MTTYKNIRSESPEDLINLRNSDGLTESFLEDLIKKAIMVYNKYRSPEANVKLIKLHENLIAVEFFGTFCETCGVIDWIEDLTYTLKNFNVNAELIRIIEPKDLNEGYRIGIFKIKNYEELTITVSP